MRRSWLANHRSPRSGSYSSTPTSCSISIASLARARSGSSKRSNKVRFTIRNLARKRFALGYPPRKQNATSLGDSINWEWIVHCAINSDDYHNVLIVSRDSDYGVNYEGEATLNDWLYREFKE